MHHHLVKVDTILIETFKCRHLPDDSVPDLSYFKKNLIIILVQKGVRCLVNTD
jgi:hypothetical protein